MAPEQTGRMNRSIDLRSDLYALGVTFYQMLTGRLPFTRPIRWNGFIAISRGSPCPPSERLEGVPAVISEIVMKLLAKTAEDRYQTAVGLEHDLRRCSRRNGSLTGCIAPFALGERDAVRSAHDSGEAVRPRARGRGLARAFDRVVASGSPELVLVSGYSGIGKSSVVNELHKALVPPAGCSPQASSTSTSATFPIRRWCRLFRAWCAPFLARATPS